MRLGWLPALPLYSTSMSEYVFFLGFFERILIESNSQFFVVNDVLSTASLKPNCLCFILAYNLYVMQCFKNWKSWKGCKDCKLCKPILIITKLIWWGISYDFCSPCCHRKQRRYRTWAIGLKTWERNTISKQRPNSWSWNLTSITTFHQSFRIFSGDCCMLGVEIISFLSVTWAS